jgi:hypothetical protein
MSHPHCLQIKGRLNCLRCDNLNTIFMLFCQVRVLLPLSAYLEGARRRWQSDWIIQNYSASSMFILRPWNYCFLLSAYVRCVTEPFCAANTVQGYMTKFGKVSINQSRVWAEIWSNYYNRQTLGNVQECYCERSLCCQCWAWFWYMYVHYFLTNLLLILHFCYAKTQVKCLLKDLTREAQNIRAMKFDLMILQCRISDW